MRSRIARLAASAAATLFAALPAQAGVVFNWVQSGEPSPVNQYRSFAVEVSDQTYLAALTAPVTFGVYSAHVGADQSSSGYLTAQVGSPDVGVAVRIQNDFSGDVQIVTLSQGLSSCNAPPWQTLVCRVGFNSSAVLPNTTFTSFFQWGAGLYFSAGNQSSSFTLSGNALSVSYSSSVFENTAFITTDSSGSGSWGVLSDGFPTPLRGTGYWLVDASTIPLAAVPLPDSAWLMAAGLVGVALRTRRRPG